MADMNEVSETSHESGPDHAEDRAHDLDVVMDGELRRYVSRSASHAWQVSISPARVPVGKGVNAHQAIGDEVAVALVAPGAASNRVRDGDWLVANGGMLSHLSNADFSRCHMRIGPTSYARIVDARYGGGMVDVFLPRRGVGEATRLVTTMSPNAFLAQFRFKRDEEPDPGEDVG